MSRTNFKQSVAFAQAQQYATQHNRPVHLSLEGCDGFIEQITVLPQGGVVAKTAGWTAEGQGDRTDTMYWQISSPSAGIYNTDAPHPLIFIDYDDQGNICGVSLSGTLAFKSYMHGLDYAMWLAGKSKSIEPGVEQEFTRLRRQIATTLGLKNYSLTQRNMEHEMLARTTGQR